MSVIIKPGVMKYRDPNDGTYKGVDAVAERTTSEQVADIVAEGASQISAVTAAGTAASANFPQTAAACDTLAGDFAATYVPNQAYSAGDYCTYQYQLYKCKVDIPENTDATFVTAHWTVVKLANTLNDEVGDLKKSLNYLVDNFQQYFKIV